MSGQETYDLSPTQREILEHRAARRQTLRHEYLRSVLNPYLHASGRSGHAIEDPGIERFMAARSTMSEFPVRTWKSGGFFILNYVIPVTILILIVKADREHREHLQRTGQVAYRDKTYKIY